MIKSFAEQMTWLFKQGCLIITSADRDASGNLPDQKALRSAQGNKPRVEIKTHFMN